MKKTVSKEALQIIMENAAWEELGLTPPKLKSEKKVDESKDTKNKKVDEEASEDELHVCPLCESKLETQIPDDKLMEHVANVLEAVEDAQAINEEAEEDEDEEVEEDESEEDEDLEDEDEDEDLEEDEDEDE